MFIYLVALAFILILTIRFGNLRDSRSMRLLLLWTLFVALICGLKDMLGGYDFYIYAEIFDRTSNEIEYNVPWLETTAFTANPTEQGYAVFVTLFSYITANRYIFFLLYSLLLYATLYYHINKLSKYPIVAFFILFCIFYFFTFTYMRQVLAASITWFSIPYAIKRKPVPFFIIVAIAATFHNSALLFTSVYFLANKNYTKAQLCIFFCLSLLLGFTTVGTFLFNILGGAVNEDKTSTALAYSNQARIEYIFEAIFFFILILINYNEKEKDPLSICMRNIALLFTIILTFFVRFTDGGRMSWYFLIGIAATVSQICVDEHRRKENKLVVYTVVSLLFIRILVSWGGLLSPYKTFLTPGVRENDEIWERYEYDHMYDNNKLYRTPIKLLE